MIFFELIRLQQLLKQQQPYTTWKPLAPPPPTYPVHTTKEPWPTPKQRTNLVFAKACISENRGRTDACDTSIPAANFGKVLIAGATLLPPALGSLKLSIGADAMLGRIAGEGILQQGFTWLLRGAGGPASVFVLGMLPSTMGDDTLYTDEQLRQMTQASTRVRFQFRQGLDGKLQVYGIHTTPTGDDTVRTVNARWTDSNKRGLEAELNGLTILWTPKHAKVDIPYIPYPVSDNTRLGEILVHPIPENTDSQIEGFPAGDDITIDDCIVVFPADSGLNSLYLVFARPIGGDFQYHPSPDTLSAFPDAKPTKPKSSVRGGGHKRNRWVDKKGRIYEWDFENGNVELYNKQGKHLGEFNPITGERTKEATPGRSTPK